jgi:hypothetical protein
MRVRRFSPVYEYTAQLNRRVKMKKRRKAAKAWVGCEPPLKRTTEKTAKKRAKKKR